MTTLLLDLTLTVCALAAPLGLTFGVSQVAGWLIDDAFKGEYA